MQKEGLRRTNNSVSRALHNSAQHKTAIDTYYASHHRTDNGCPPVFNCAPAAANDAYTIECSAAATFNVLANDTDPDGDTLTIPASPTLGKVPASFVWQDRLHAKRNHPPVAAGALHFTLISDGRGIVDSDGQRHHQRRTEQSAGRRDDRVDVPPAALGVELAADQRS